MDIAARLATGIERNFHPTPGNGQFSRTGRRALPGQLRAAHARTGHNRDPGAAPPAFFPNQPQFPKGVPKFFRVLTASRIFPVPDRADRPRRPVSSARVAVRMRGSTARSSRPYQTRSTLSPLLSGVGGIVRAKQVTDRRFARFGGRISACRCGAVATALRDTTGTPRAALFRNRLLCWHSQSDESLRSRRDKASYGQHAVILLSKVLRKFSRITFVW